jgi:hypothetical protein
MTRALLVFVLCASACAPVDVVVAEVPAEPDGGRPLPPGPCAKNEDCPPDRFCEKPDCDTVVGQCHPRPVFCGDAPNVVCGCNGVNYWNDCLRRAQGIRAATFGECTTSAASCGGTSGATCPDADASCAKLLPSASACTANPEGTCWFVPTNCPVGGGGAWTPCAGGACADTCTAIRSGAVHSRTTSCP